MTNEQIQALKAAAEKWKAADKQYDKGEITIAEFLAANEEYGRLVIKPAATLSLLAEREADKALIAEQAKNIAKLERALDLARNSNSVLAIRSEL
ncbi:hypothetical protein SLJ66_001990, partial [Escherichia coli]|nr:hypothetical protein [Escherichia coli]